MTKTRDDIKNQLAATALLTNAYKYAAHVQGIQSPDETVQLPEEKISPRRLEIGRYDEVRVSEIFQAAQRQFFDPNRNVWNLSKTGIQDFIENVGAHLGNAQVDKPSLEDMLSIITAEPSPATTESATLVEEANTELEEGHLLEQFLPQQEEHQNAELAPAMA